MSCEDEGRDQGDAPARRGTAKTAGRLAEGQTGNSVLSQPGL